ncbi:VPLPA-CTERM-specific exosortase XrtD [Ruegeria sp. R13_0]|uniref:VPLPA-CTERM-specific exosortase XrtD n=1 Tax=Ruegeria sp. R13_0 TaxID=2821099 RepID=UPI001ADBDAEA|nr:VPLPA-CTERM-specific exosortase XrtD [Ruegeria sp. R13_0]MBO9436748.1 VPLPA-CTERM-specific exosortase XrtD [Ruegeria sp. R13_0]
MSVTNEPLEPMKHGTATRSAAGVFWLVLMVIGAVAFFQEGIAELFRVWQLPEYSHGPLIPVLSGLLFLRQLKTVPIDATPVRDFWQGAALLAFALVLGGLGMLIGIPDIVAYGLILWVGAVLLISFGWKQGRAFWPPVLHLVYMLPLPGALYYGVSTWLQLISSELGVWFLDVLRVPVFLDGNIIDLGVYRLHVAEACSGLRYLFPILSFSYIFAVLYQGPTWHKAILLVSAVPITVVMNSIRIAVAGIVVNAYGIDYIQGLTHFFEGWVIFISCVLILFAIAWILVRFRRDQITLVEALDLETDGLWEQAKRIRFIAPSVALIVGAILVIALNVLWQNVPNREAPLVNRDPFALFPTQLGDWHTGQPRALDPDIERILNAADYHSVSLERAGEVAPVDLFMVWYKDQNTGGVHSPEVCLPGSGWEIAWLEQIDVSDGTQSFPINRAIIQKGLDRRLVYYWYEQQGTRVASGFKAKLLLLSGKVINGRSDSAMVRLITPINPEEGEMAADLRLHDSLWAVEGRLERFVPWDGSL